MKIKAQFTRKFLGKIDNFTDKREENFEKKHLKAYLKGHQRFSDGYERGANGKIITDGRGNKIPKYYDVKQEVRQTN